MINNNKKNGEEMKESQIKHESKERKEWKKGRHRKHSQEVRK